MSSLALIPVAFPGFRIGAILNLIQIFAGSAGMMRIASQRNDLICLHKVNCRGNRFCFVNNCDLSAIHLEIHLEIHFEIHLGQLTCPGKAELLGDFVGDV